jgi:hypothetical protein
VVDATLIQIKVTVKEIAKTTILLTKSRSHTFI